MRLLKTPIRTVAAVALVITTALVTGVSVQDTVQAQESSPESLAVTHLLTNEMFLAVEQQGIVTRIQEVFGSIEPNGFYLVPFELQHDELQGVTGFPSESNSEIDRVFRTNVTKIAEVNSVGGNAQLFMNVRLENGILQEGAFVIQVGNTYPVEDLGLTGDLTVKTVSEGSFWMLDEQSGAHLMQQTRPDSELTFVLPNQQIREDLQNSAQQLGKDISFENVGFLPVELDTDGNIVQIITSDTALIFGRRVIERLDRDINLRALPGVNYETVAWETSLIGLPFELDATRVDDRPLRDIINELFPNSIEDANGQVIVNVNSQQWTFMVTPNGFGFMRRDVTPESTLQSTPVPTQMFGLDLQPTSVPEIGIVNETSEVLGGPERSIIATTIGAYERTESDVTDIQRFINELPNFSELPRLPDNISWTTRDEYYDEFDNYLGFPAIVVGSFEREANKYYVIAIPRVNGYTIIPLGFNSYENELDDSNYYFGVIGENISSDRFTNPNGDFLNFIAANNINIIGTHRWAMRVMDNAIAEQTPVYLVMNDDREPFFDEVLTAIRENTAPPSETNGNGLRYGHSGPTVIVTFSR